MPPCSKQASTVRILAGVRNGEGAEWWEGGEGDFRRGLCESNASWLVHREMHGGQTLGCARRARLTTNAGVTWITHCGRRKRDDETSEYGPQWYFWASLRERERTHVAEPEYKRIYITARTARSDAGRGPLTRTDWTTREDIAPYKNHTNFWMLPEPLVIITEGPPGVPPPYIRLNVCERDRVWRFIKLLWSIKAWC